MYESEELCHRCGVITDRPGRQCSQCLGYIRRWRQDRKELGLCPRCGEVTDRPGKHCSECLEEYRDYNARRRVAAVKRD